MRDPDLAACLGHARACQQGCLELIAKPGPELDELTADQRVLVRDLADVCGLTAEFIARGSGRITYACWLCARLCRLAVETLAGRTGRSEGLVLACRKCAEVCEPLGLMLDPKADTDREYSF